MDAAQHGLSDAEVETIATVAQRFREFAVQSASAILMVYRGPPIELGRNAVSLRLQTEPGVAAGCVHAGIAGTGP
jgi:hypothetical protein